MIWNDTLFRRKASGIHAIPPLSERRDIIKMFHDDIGHWDAITTRVFVRDRFWWPGVYRDILDYVRGCDGCQHAQRLPTYHKNLRAPVTGLFETFSIDFAGPPIASRGGKRFVIIAVEHLTGWPIAWATESSTADTVINFVHEEIVLPFGPPRRIVSDNANAFTAGAVEDFMKKHGIEWNTVLAYAPMANGRAERMVATIKLSIKRTVIRTDLDWADSIPRILCGYRRRGRGTVPSPFQLMYGIRPRMIRTDTIALMQNGSAHHRVLELLGASGDRAMQVARTFVPREPKGKMKLFNVGDEVLVAHGAAFNKAKKWPTFQSYYYGPCKIVQADHPRYGLVSRGGRVSRTVIHARRLVLYGRKPAHLQS